MSEDPEDAAAERRFQAGIREVEQERRREFRQERERAIAEAGGAEAFIAALRKLEEKATTLFKGHADKSLNCPEEIHEARALLARLEE